MEAQEAAGMARQLMLEFADHTGLGDSGMAPKRYLWTDAFAVCNFLELYRQSGDESWRELALRLVDQVHHVLGRHRADSSRRGWLSGLSEEEGELHPTRGGLRIGKELNERLPNEPLDERLEWDRDGQYYHYLTKWMHALHCVSRVTGDARYLRWGLELAQAAHRGFSYTPSWGGGKRLYWKMNIDLTHPQVLSMGQHDPLDGLVTCRELEAAARALDGPRLPNLQLETATLEAICRGKGWATDDTLGIGGLLCDAFGIAQLMVKGEFAGGKLLQEVLKAALLGLGAVAESKSLELPGRYRLAFRELGLSIGLKGVEPMLALVEQQAARFSGAGGSLRRRLQLVRQHLPLAQSIDSFWLQGVNQESGAWKEHSEINAVMLATSLAPGEFLSAG